MFDASMAQSKAVHNGLVEYGSPMATRAPVLSSPIQGSNLESSTSLLGSEWALLLTLFTVTVLGPGTVVPAAVE